MAETKEDRILLVLKRTCLGVLGALLAGSILFASPRFTLGVAVGGGLSIINLYWLRNILVRALAMEPGRAARFSQVRYLLRLGMTAVAVYVTIDVAHADVFGVLAGLSVVVIAVIALTIYMLSSREV